MSTERDTVNIIYASNDGYARHLAASLYSLLAHSRRIPSLEIWVLSAGMCGEYQDRLRRTARHFKRELHVAELGDLRERFPYEVDTRGFDISAMGRIFAPEVLPEQMERALYLDCDTIVLGDVGELYWTDLGDCLAGMVMEPTVYQEMKETIGFGRDDAYFNSGVILMDLAGWRREGVLARMLEFYGAHAGSLFACDQDTINGTLRGRIRSLPPKYNFFTNYRYFRYSTLEKLCGAYRKVGAEAFKEAKRRPVIIHYLGDERPWIAGNHNHYRRLYQYCLDHTPFKGEPPERGKVLYMQLWWCFNQMTRVCPGLRLWISRRFGMKVIDGRKKKKDRTHG